MRSMTGGGAAISLGLTVSPFIRAAPRRLGARLAGVWLTADAPDILHPARPGRGGGRAVGSLFPLEGGMGRDPEFMALMPAALEVVPEHVAAGDVWIATGVDGEIRWRRRARARRCAGYAELDQAVRRAAPYPQRRRPGATRARRRRGATARLRAADDPG